MKIIPNTSVMLSAVALAAVALSIGTASAAGVVTAKNGMTLYVFDKDTAGMSTCYDDCAKMWPAYLGKKTDKMSEGWTLVKRTGGKMQWAYDAKPVYFYKSDMKKGDMMGDGIGNAWHIIKE